MGDDCYFYDLPRIITLSESQTVWIYFAGGAGNKIDGSAEGEELYTFTKAA